MTMNAWIVAVVGVVLAVAPGLGGCARYITPGARADFRALGITPEQAEAMTDASIAARLSRRPAASFPASIAAVRVQAPGYTSYSYEGGGRGSGGLCHIVTVREVETDAHFARLTSLPMIAGVATVNSLIAPERVESEKDLRMMAAALQADMVLIYTLDTAFGSETIVPVLGTITLGLFPAKEARVTSTASAALVDTRTGYIYGLAEGTAKTEQLANAWTTKEAIDQSRRRAESEAFDKLVGEMEVMWKGVVARYVGERGEPTDQGTGHGTQGRGAQVGPVQGWAGTPIPTHPASQGDPRGPVAQMKSDSRVEMPLPIQHRK